MCSSVLHHWMSSDQPLLQSGDCLLHLHGRRGIDYTQRVQLVQVKYQYPSLLLFEFVSTTVLQFMHNAFLLNDRTVVYEQTYDKESPTHTRYTVHMHYGFRKFLTVTNFLHNMHACYTVVTPAATTTVLRLN